MEAYKIKANEEFFDKMRSMLKEGGSWIFPAAGEIFIKRSGKLLGTAAGLKEVEGIVSDEYFKNNFGILKD